MRILLIAPPESAAAKTTEEHYNKLSHETLRWTAMEATEGRINDYIPDLIVTISSISTLRLVKLAQRNTYPILVIQTDFFPVYPMLPEGYNPNLVRLCEPMQADESPSIKFLGLPLDEVFFKEPPPEILSQVKEKFHLVDGKSTLLFFSDGLLQDTLDTMLKEIAASEKYRVILVGETSPTPGPHSVSLHHEKHLNPQETACLMSCSLTISRPTSYRIAELAQLKRPGLFFRANNDDLNGAEQQILLMFSDKISIHPAHQNICLSIQHAQQKYATLPPICDSMGWQERLTTITDKLLATAPKIERGSPQPFLATCRTFSTELASTVLGGDPSQDLDSQEDVAMLVHTLSGASNISDLSGRGSPMEGA